MLPPNNHKDLKSFFGKINFVQKFISGFAELVHPLNDLLKKGVKIKWTPKFKRSFQDIKVLISATPVLVIPNYQLPFKVYSFTLENLCANILTQKKEHEDERPIIFMSFPLKNVDLNYPNLDKNSFALVKEIKNL